MLCHMCGEEIEPEDTICLSCGERIPGRRTGLSGAIPASRCVALIGGALIIVGSFLPWATADTIFGSFSIKGIETDPNIDGDGIISLILGISIIVSCLIRFNKAGTRAIATGILALLALALGIFEFTDIKNGIESISGLSVTYSVSTGVYLVIAGGMLGMAAFLRNPE